MNTAFCLHEQYQQLADELQAAKSEHGKTWKMQLGPSNIAVPTKQSTQHLRESRERIDKLEKKDTRGVRSVSLCYEV